MISSRRFSLASAVLLTIAFLAGTDCPAQRNKSYNEGNESLAILEKYCIGRHDIGRLVFGVTNFGMVGIGEGKGAVIDCFTGTRVKLGEYPKGDNNTYFYKGGLWVGAVIDRDTLVSSGADFNNSSREMHPTSALIKRSTLDPRSPEFTDAISELDYVATYADTFTSGVRYGSFDPIDNRPHKPLGIEVSQRSLSWSYAHTNDFVLIEYEIRNIGKKYLKDTYLGVYWDIDVHTGDRPVNISVDPYGGKSNPGGRDDITGFIFKEPAFLRGCEYYDTMIVAWTADNDGTPSPEGKLLTPHISGIRLLGSFSSNVKISYNWWNYNYVTSYDFGPQHKDNFRNMGNGSGTPFGDRNKYHLLSNGEIDYDQVYTGRVGPGNNTWVQPTDLQASRARDGVDNQFLLSIGPYDLGPGASASIPIAFIAGENFHSNPLNFGVNLHGRYSPDDFYENVDFSDFLVNAATAQRVYDIPGFDTDEDGFAGKFRVCVLDSVEDDGQWVPSVAETTFYEGDGVPDWKAAAPPPAPVIWVQPIRNGFRVRFNGWKSETAEDIFSKKVDFEGYRIYIARDDRETSYSTIASYDRKNYDKQMYIYDQYGSSRFQVMDDPFTLDELRCLYSKQPDPCTDSSFDPLTYSRIDPYVHPKYPDSIFYFTPHDFNVSEFGVNTKIQRTYPNEPPLLPYRELEIEQLTEDGYPKFYEYECFITDLLPNVPYYVAVTSFDFGSPSSGLQPLESARSLTATSAYPDNSWDEKPDDVKNVYVFPNPYRHDGWYRLQGFEGRGEEDRSRDRVRQVTFANLPAKCTISIFTLDGDLIKEMKHDFDSSDPNSSYHEWDLVTRNIQKVVSGMYYWVVEDDQGRRQIGKLVILL